MPEPLLKIAFLTPKAGLDAEAFTTYWRETHGPTVAGSPGYGQWRTRYAQNHVIAAGPLGQSFGFAGMAEFRLPGDDPNEDAFATTAIYRDRIAPDERRFIDMDRTVSMTAREQVIRPRSGGAVKLVVLSRREVGIATADLRPRFDAQVVQPALAGPAFARLLRGWTAAHVIEGSFRLPGARPVPALAVDVVESLWFDTPQDVEAACGEAAFAHERHAPSGPLDGTATRLFMAREIVFFDNGRVAT